MGAIIAVMSDKYPGISVVIPTYNGEKTIGKTIESILNQKYDGELDIIVVNDCSIDDTLKVVQQYPIKIINNDTNLGFARSVNKGVKASKNDIVSVIHEDILLAENEWFKKLVPYLKDDEVALVSSPVILSKEIYEKFGFWEKALFSWDLKEDYENSVEICTDGYSDLKNVIFKKDTFLKFWGLDGETYRAACEDVDLSIKLFKVGYKMVSVPTPVYHLHSSRVAKLSRILFEYRPRLAEGQGVLFRKYRFRAWDINNQIFKTLAVIVLFIPSNFIRIFGALYIATIVFGNAVRAFKVMKDLKVFMLVPPVKLLDYFLDVFYFWKGFITGRQRK
ncbi:MAG: glycosyltransferase family 2 protein [Methanosarcinales archaeon]|nr:MAG: glycosyltransferase family 2 protein [Methanosarcinales archaeon]